VALGSQEVCVRLMRGRPPKCARNDNTQRAHTHTDTLSQTHTHTHTHTTGDVAMTHTGGEKSMSARDRVRDLRGMARVACFTMNANSCHPTTQPRLTSLTSHSFNRKELHVHLRLKTLMSRLERPIDRRVCRSIYRACRFTWTPHRQGSDIASPKIIVDLSTIDRSIGRDRD